LEYGLDDFFDVDRANFVYVFEGVDDWWSSDFLVGKEEVCRRIDQVQRGKPRVRETFQVLLRRLGHLGLEGFMVTCDAAFQSLDNQLYRIESPRRRLEFQLQEVRFPDGLHCHHHLPLSLLKIGDMKEIIEWNL
jgi:hypothetical protein